MGSPNQVRKNKGVEIPAQFVFNINLRDGATTMEQLIELWEPYNPLDEYIHMGLDLSLALKDALEGDVLHLLTKPNRHPINSSDLSFYQPHKYLKTERESKDYV